MCDDVLLDVICYTVCKDLLLCSAVYCLVLPCEYVLVFATMCYLRLCACMCDYVLL
jgi:hypothetical protein